MNGAPIQARLVYRFRVLGLPATAGSKKMQVRQRGRGGPRYTRLVDDCAHGPEWRNSVAVAFRMAYPGAPERTDALVLHAILMLPRPPAHHRGGRREKPLTAHAPQLHTYRPDGTKLVRALEDALTGLAWKDDSQLVSCTWAKRWCPEGEQGALVTVLEADRNADSWWMPCGPSSSERMRAT